MADENLNFMQFLQAFRRGEVLAEADQQLRELVEAIDRTGAGGTLTLKLAFKVNKAGQIEVDPQVAIKAPKRALGTGIFYATEDGGLSRRDPRQMDIEDEIERRRNGEG